MSTNLFARIPGVTYTNKFAHVPGVIYPPPAPPKRTYNTARKRCPRGNYVTPLIIELAKRKGIRALFNGRSGPRSNREVGLLIGRSSSTVLVLRKYLGIAPAPFSRFKPNPAKKAKKNKKPLGSFTQ